MKKQTIAHCKITFWVFTLLIGVSIITLSCNNKQNESIETPAVPEPPIITFTPVTRQMFFQPIRYSQDIIIDAGTLGRYRFTPEVEVISDVPSHIICQELVDLLNEMQRILKQPIRIVTGYRSTQHQVYLWAKWLADHPEHIDSLNQQAHATWAEWIQASQEIPGAPDLRSKHRTGEAVKVSWETLKTASTQERAKIADQIRKIGSTPAHISEPQQNNGRFTVTPPPEKLSEEPTAQIQQAYFHIVYKPSNTPPMPKIKQIGELIPKQHDVWTLTNPNSGFSVSLKTQSEAYQVKQTFTLQIRATDDVHIIILNKDEAGNLVMIIPYLAQQDNRVRANTTYYIPEKDAANTLFWHTANVEQLKVIALRSNRANSDIINIFQKYSQKELSNTNTTLQLLGVKQDDTKEVEKNMAAYLHQLPPQNWAEVDDTITVKAAEETDQVPSGPYRIPPDYDTGDTVYIKDGSHMYFAQVTGKLIANSQTVNVKIFNEALRQKLGDTVPATAIVGRRTEPPRGWGIHEIMLSFYREGEWTFTTEAVVFENYYLLPEHINGEPLTGTRQAHFGEVRVPVAVSFSID